MAGITGFKPFLKEISREAKIAARAVYKQGARSTLTYVMTTTKQDSGNAAFNWLVLPLGGSAPYFFLKGQPPVGDRGDKRTDTGRTNIVAKARLAQASGTIIAASRLSGGGLTFTNSIDSSPGDPAQYVVNAKITQVLSAVQDPTIHSQIESHAYQNVKSSRGGRHVIFS